MRRARRVAPAQGGFSLIELLVATVLALLVLGAVITVLVSTNRLGAQDVERPIALDEAQGGVARMARELRQAYRILATDPTGNWIDFVASVPTATGRADRRLVYDCGQASDTQSGYRRCVRYEGTAPTRTQTLSDLIPAQTAGAVTDPSSTTTVIDRLVNGTASDPVFHDFQPSSAAPTYFQLTVKVPAKGERPAGFGSQIIADDGIFLRNLAAG